MCELSTGRSPLGIKAESKAPGAWAKGELINRVRTKTEFGGKNEHPPVPSGNSVQKPRS